MAPAAEEHHRLVVSLFGDDGDAAPLWFKKDAFSSSSFDPEAYISDLRRFVPFETLRAELRAHLGGLKNELVELINRNYMDFVNLRTKLVDVDGALLRMRMPLNELRGKLVLVTDNVNATLVKSQDGLKRRANMSVSREILVLLLDTSHVVSKSLAMEYQPQCIHAAHNIVHGRISRNQDTQEDTPMSPDAIAELYWQVHKQHRSARTHELDLRPFLKF